MTAAIRRLVSGAIAFRSTRSRRLLTPERARRSPPRPTRRPPAGRSTGARTTRARPRRDRGEARSRALSASAIVLALRPTAVPTTRAPPRRSASATALPIAPGLTIPTVGTRNESTNARRRSARRGTSRGGAGRSAEHACRPGVRSAASTSRRRDPGPSSPTRSGEVVTNSSSTASASRNPPNVCGPASQRIRRWPLARSARRTTSGAMRRPGPSATTVDAEGTRPSRCSAPASLVRTSAPDASSGCPTSMSPLPVRMATSGAADAPKRSRSSAYSEAAGGKIPSGRQVPRGLARSTPAPMSTASANARSRPITNRSASLFPAMNSFERGIAGIATTPSTVATKLAYTQSSASPRSPS